METNNLLPSIIKNRLIASLFLFLVSFAVFIPSLNNDFVWDDIPYLLNRIENLTISKQINKVIPKKSNNKSDYYRPMLHISLALDNDIWNGKSLGFHLSNIVMHSITTVLLFFLALLILKELNYTRQYETAFVSSLLFALHPIHVESVSFILARSDLLCAVFLMGFFIFYIKSYEKLYYLPLCIVFFGLALISKEVAFVFPFLIVLYDIIRPKFPKREYIIRYSICLIIFLIYLYIRNRGFVVIPEISQAVIGQDTGGLEKISILAQSFLNAYGFYAYKFVYPFNFNITVGRLAVDIRFIIVSVSLIILMFLFVYRRYRFNLLGLTFAIISLIPAVFVSVVDVVTSPYAERFLYIPSIGFCMVLGYLFVHSEQRFKLPIYSIWAVLVFVCLIYSVFTIKEQFVWKNSYTLWKKAVERSPQQPMPRLNYGYSLMNKGQIDGAIDQFAKAVEYEKDHNKSQKALAYNNLGTAYMGKGDFKKAMQSFEHANKIDPKYELTYKYHKGLIYYLEGDKIYRQNESLAEEKYKKALQVLLEVDKRSKYNRRLHLLVAEVYLRLGDFKQAHKFAGRSLKSGKAKLDKKQRERAEYILNYTERYK